MENGYVTLPLDVYHEYLGMEKRMTEAVNRVSELKAEIKGIYHIEVFPYPTAIADPLSPNRVHSALVKVNKRKLNKLLNINEDPNIQIKWVIE